jgi:hypothetical protein
LISHHFETIQGNQRRLKKKLEPFSSQSSGMFLAGWLRSDEESLNGSSFLVRTSGIAWKIYQSACPLALVALIALGLLTVLKATNRTPDPWTIVRVIA